MEDHATISTTENGDKACFSDNWNLSFFARITRGAPISDYIDAFTKAWKENKEIAFQVLMNMRDVRNGKGEKLIPAVVMVYLKFTLPLNIYEAMLRKMIEYGYWKDLLRIIDIERRTHLEHCKHAILETFPIEVKLFAEQLKNDTDTLAAQTISDGKKMAISLCAKWAPSENTHYDHHPILAATNIRNALGLKPKQYRLMLTKLRKHIGVLETLMSTQCYDQIDFSKIPSVAIMKMKHAFSRDSNADGVESESRKKLHESYADYLRKLAEGKTKINIKGIQPHELVNTYMHGCVELDYLVEEQWKALKKRVLETGSFRDVTAIVDVSGSMAGQPMEVAIALGILVAECTKGPFHGKCITFDDNPSWHHLNGETLQSQIKCMKSAPWGGSTNLRATFDMILREAVSADLTSDEMVKTLFIFTDMQFNECQHGAWQSTFEYANEKFENAGYKLPRIVCWNLRTSNTKTVPVTKDEDGYVMLSGFSAELLKCILTAQEFSPYAMMMHVLEPYSVPTEVSSCTVTELQPSFGLLTELETAVGKSMIKKAFKEQKNLVPNSLTEL
jgi:hypothetical protein